MAKDMKDIVKDWFTAWNSHDVNKLAAFYADDCIYEQVQIGTVCNGKKEFTENVSAMFADFPDVKIEQKFTLISENAVCGEVVISGTQAHSSDPAIQATGKSFSARGAYVSEWQNGITKRHSFYADGMTIMQQLGLMP